MIYGYKKYYFVITCDICGKKIEIEKTKQIYNGAQAARSTGWSFGKNKKIKCNQCRLKEFNDKHKYTRRK